jgi:ABC-type sugar transport system substrate-binding protein
VSRLARLLVAALLPMALVTPAIAAVSAAPDPKPTPAAVPPSGTVVIFVGLSNGGAIDPIGTAVVPGAYCMAVTP